MRSVRFLRRFLRAFMGVVVPRPYTCRQWTLAILFALLFPCHFALASRAGETPTDASAAPSSVQLQGTVQKISLDLNQLRDVGLDLKHLVKSLSSLYDEVTIQPMTMISEPEVVGPVVISIPTVPVPAGPPEPPRKERVDLAMSSIKPTIDLMKSNVNEFVAGQVQFDLPEATITQIKPLFDQWVSGVNDLYSKELELETMAAGPPYNNYKIADQTMNMEKEIKKLDESRHAIFKIVRAEGEKLLHEERKEENQRE
jgi:hypothetical protein